MVCRGEGRREVERRVSARPSWPELESGLVSDEGSAVPRSRHIRKSLPSAHQTQSPPATLLQPRPHRGVSPEGEDRAEAHAFVTDGFRCLLCTGVQAAQCVEILSIGSGFSGNVVGIHFKMRMVVGYSQHRPAARGAYADHYDVPRPVYGILKQLVDHAPGVVFAQLLLALSIALGHIRVAHRQPPMPLMVSGESAGDVASGGPRGDFGGHGSS